MRGYFVEVSKWKGSEIGVLAKFPDDPMETSVL